VGQLSSRYILITGCDTGFGHELAKRLDAAGCYVFAGCLTESGETELRKCCSSRLQTISLDVSNQQSVRNAFQTVSDKLPQGQGLWGLMNNAGILGRCGPHEFLNMDDYHQVLGVNLLGLVDVTMTFLPLVKRSHGRIVNTASVFGRHVIAGCPPYCISKYGVEAFTDGLRRAMRGFDVKAILIEPGIHRTPIMSKSNIDRLQQEAWDRASPESRLEYGEEFIRRCIAEGHDNTNRIASSRVSDVVDAYEHALLGRFPRARYLVGNDARFLWMPIQWLPEWLGDWVLERLNANKPIPAALKKRQ
jgi:NAD(P)-dependent dehydrogenase (short-subunit alcohol dehydrogenase family)